MIAAETGLHLRRDHHHLISGILGEVVHRLSGHVGGAVGDLGVS